MENNKTNIEKADEIAGYLDKIGLIRFKKLYIGFLVSNPSLITSFGVLVDNHKNGTVSGQDYIYATLSLAGIATGILGLAVLDYLNSEYYDDAANYVKEITSHLNGLLNDLSKQYQI